MHHQNQVFTEISRPINAKCVLAAINCNSTSLPSFINSQTVTPNMTLFPYAYDVIYTCDSGYRFEDGNIITSVTCSITGWAWNHIVTSCGRTLLAFMT